MVAIDIEAAKKAFLDAMDAMRHDHDALHEFQDFVFGQFDAMDHSHCHGGAGPVEQAATQNPLQAIRQYLRKKVDVTATYENESIKTDCMTVHVDAFLWPEEDLDELFDEQRKLDKPLLSRSKCLDCGSLKTQELDFMMLKCKSPGSVGRDKVFCDVGSRLGAALYGAHYLGDFSKIVGVEMNPSFCRLQNETIKNFSLDNVSIVEGKIEEQSAEFMNSVDIFLFHFEYFHGVSERKKIWSWLIKNICRPGQIIITIPELYEQLSDCFEETDPELNETWVLEVTPREMMAELAQVFNWDEEKMEEVGKIGVYQVPPPL